MSKAPGKKTSTTNILRIFDKISWILIFASLLLVSLGLIAASKIKHIFGGKKPDIVSLILLPLAMLNAEGMPEDNRTRKKSKGGFSLNVFLLHWSVMGMVLVFCFLCNLRAMILKPTMEAPIDTTKDLVLNGITPILVSGRWTEYMEASVNEWHRKACEIAYKLPNPTLVKENLETLVQQDGTHSVMTHLYEIAYNFKENSPAVHLSKETISSYYNGWVTAKQSPWKKILDDHIGIIHQVSKKNPNIILEPLGASEEHLLTTSKYKLISNTKHGCNNNIYNNSNKKIHNNNISSNILSNDIGSKNIICRKVLQGALFLLQ